MSTRKINQFLFLVLVVWALGCTQAYNPPATKNSNHYLVVDGFINSGPDSTVILLSWTEPLSDSQYKFQPETGAQVTVEGNGSDSYSLAEIVNGQYVAVGLNLNPQESYRLRILTSNGEQFLSDYVPVLANPPIDSVNWQQQPDGLQIYVNTHDPSNQIKNFRWDYTETWEYKSHFETRLMYLGNGQIAYLDSTTQVDSCWSSAVATNINIASTSRLSQAVVYLRPVTWIPNGSVKLSQNYSILVRQYPLSDSSYQYWTSIQKNNEQLGNIFSPLPTEVTGNIHSLTHPGEPVMGFISAGLVRQLRIFIRNDQLQNWVYQTYCESKVTTSDSLDYYYRAGWRLVDAFGLNWLISSSICVDCRLLGGSTSRPVFMP
jgi:hypothetical protein